MLIFQALGAIRDFERAELSFIRTMEDLDIVREIGFHQEAGQPLTLKTLYTLRIGAAATIQRRLAALKKLGVVEQIPMERDRRSFALHLSPAALKAYERYLSLMRKISGRRVPR
jgi:DNA-binding MarR family transcriptional regulator